MCELIILIVLSIPTIALSLIYLKEGYYLLSFIICVSFAILSLYIISDNSNKQQNDINIRYEELTAETAEKSVTEKSAIKMIAKNKSNIVNLEIIELNGINSLIVKAKDFNVVKHVFTCNKCLKTIQQDYVNAYSIKNIEIYWDKGNYKFNSNTVIQLSSISIN
jgi:hypothetical protein